MAGAEEAKRDDTPMVPKKAPKQTAPFKASTSCPTCAYINPLAWLLIAIDFVAWLLSTLVGGGLVQLCKRSFAKEFRTVEVNGSRRLGVSEASLKERGVEGCDTAFDCVMHSMDTYPNNQCFGTRTYLGTHLPERARYPLKKFGRTTWQTYAQVKERALLFGAGLKHLGMVPLPEDEGLPSGAKFEDTTDPHTMLIYEETCADWMTSVIGAFSQSLAVATSYATLGVSSVADAAVECNVKVIVCNMKDVDKIAAESSKMPMLTHIVYTKNYVTEEEARSPPAGSDGITVLSMDRVVELGKENRAEVNKPRPNNMAVIMYTSGSTGQPKGVMIRQQHVCASVGALMTYTTSGILEMGQETYLAYLPAAHILELCAEFAMLSIAARLGFCDPKTISSKGAVRELDDGTIVTQAVSSYGPDTTPPGGIQEFRPTIMAAVPKIWDILKKGVEDGVSNASGLIQGLFQMAFAYRNFAITHGMDTPFLNTILFKKKFKTLMGGRSKLFITGGGPISGEVQTFIRVAFATPLVQGYALTETTCAGTIQYPTDSRNGVVGPPVASVEIKLRDCVEPGQDVEGQDTGEMVPAVLDRQDRPYLATDTHHYGQPVLGRGEVLIRGPSVSSGYLKQPEKTAKEFDSDGFFHSGDIAVFTTDGCIQIVDRLKNLVKLKGGEYIAIESMEKEYAKSIFVNAITGGLLCYGDGDMDRPVALVQANLAEIRNWVAQQGLELNVDNAEALCENEQVKDAVLADLVKEGKAGGLGVNEILRAVHLISGEGSETEPQLNSPWTPENGFLTASNKLNRKPIQYGLEEILEPLKEKGIR